MGLIEEGLFEKASFKIGCESLQVEEQGSSKKLNEEQEFGSCFVWCRRVSLGKFACCGSVHEGT